EELRLGYVAYTRAKDEFVVSSHVWGSTQKPLAPSPYLLTVREMQQGWGAVSEPWYVPEEDETNPRIDNPASFEWPSTARSDERLRREEAARRVRGADPTAPDAHDRLEPEESETLARWDAEIERLLSEVRANRSSAVEVPLPSS